MTNDPSFEQSDKKVCFVIYILYIVAAVFAITAIIGVVMAYIYRSDATGYLRTHFSFQIRTFWISILVGAIGLITAFIWIGYLILLALVIWNVARAACGLKKLNRGQTLENPDSLGFIVH